MRVGAPKGGSSTGAGWLAPAAAMLSVGWGSNQFAPLLLVYHARLGIGTGTLEAMFGLYALGLIPGLLIGGPLSDRVGRRAVVLPAVGVSLAATVIVMLGGVGPVTFGTVALFTGRLAAGVASGAIFSAGTTWLRESSLVSGDGPLAARRAAVAMTAGFGLGPLVAGAIAQWAPSPTVLPYLPHLVITGAVLVLLRQAAVPARSPSQPQIEAPRLRLDVVARPRFRRVVIPTAPWVFAAPAIAFALLPDVIGIARRPDGIALTAAVTTLTALAGVLIQPVARRLDRVADGAAGVAGLVVLAGGLGIGVATVATGHVWLLVVGGLTLGAAYGLCLVAGLTEIHRLAAEVELARATSLYYSLTYFGFAAPYLIAALAAIADYTVLLATGAVAALATAVVVAIQGRRHPYDHTYGRVTEAATNR